ncbi:hypothetical protein AX17_004321 [Amanita inopinata Kibby_2008]|nr:hypothetical protein AX17_004321 [Amanita inopinata Kibby_2008]
MTTIYRLSVRKHLKKVYFGTPVSQFTPTRFYVQCSLLVPLEPPQSHGTFTIQSRPDCSSQIYVRSVMVDYRSKPLLTSVYELAIGIACLLYDHLLTFESERQAIWVNPNAHPISKMGFFLNRYATEILNLYIASVISATRQSNASVSSLAPRCLIFVWIFSISASVFTTLSHFAVIFRIYLLWDRRRTVGYLLAISFLLAVSGIGAFAVLSVVQVTPHLVYFAPLRACYLGILPKAFPATLGIISLYDLFLIALTIFNSLHVPRRHDIEVIRSLQNDSALAFILLFLLRLLNLIVSIAGNAPDALVLLSTVWSLCAVINARLQIRLERLRMSRNSNGPPPIGDHSTEEWVFLPEIKRQPTLEIL